MPAAIRGALRLLILPQHPAKASSVLSRPLALSQNSLTLSQSFGKTRGPASPANLHQGSEFYTIASVLAPQSFLAFLLLFCRQSSSKEFYSQPKCIMALSKLIRMLPYYRTVYKKGAQSYTNTFVLSYVQSFSTLLQTSNMTSFLKTIWVTKIQFYKRVWGSWHAR